MKIYIPSRSRAHITRTYGNLPPALQKHAVHVVPKDELAAYLANGLPAISPPPSVNRIAPTRQWIVEYHLKTHGHITDKMIMLDDDLGFYRYDAARDTFCSTKNDSTCILKAFAELEKQLDTFAHGGILMKLGANRFEEVPQPVYNTRACRAIAFRASILQKHWPDTKFGVVPVQDDFNATLTLMKLGYQNVIITSITQEQTGGSGSAGGASVYRDMAYHADSVHKLKARHPEYVRIATKKTDKAWGGEERIDVVVSWKKAIAAGIEEYGVRKLAKSK